MAKLRELCEGAPTKKRAGRKPGKLARPTGSSGNSGLTHPSSSAAALVAPLDLGAAHRQRLALRPHRAEAAAPRSAVAQQVEVDLDVEDLLHAADVGVPELLERVEERARALDAGAGIDDLVAVDLAAAALDLVLWMERQLGRLAAACSRISMTDCGRRAAPSARLDIRGALTASRGYDKRRRCSARPSA